MLKTTIISTLIGIVAFIAIGLVQDQTIHIPNNAISIIELLIIIMAVLAGSMSKGAPAASTSSTGSTSSGSAEQETGTVKWFNVKKGYGFITRDQGDDVFVHYRNIEGGGRRGINEGQRVSFVVINGDKGLQADEVVSI
ncbi:MAG: cold shock domain-containing protein [Pseudomonadales bacterium]